MCVKRTVPSIRVYWYAVLPIILYMYVVCILHNVWNQTVILSIPHYSVGLLRLISKQVDTVSKLALKLHIPLLVLNSFLCWCHSWEEFTMLLHNKSDIVSLVKSSITKRGAHLKIWSYIVHTSGCKFKFWQWKMVCSS